MEKTEVQKIEEWIRSLSKEEIQRVIDDAMSFTDVEREEEKAEKVRKTFLHTTGILTSMYLIKIWKEQWPNYCKGCGGIGYFHYHATREEPEDNDPCEDCTSEGLCPRCGKPGLTSEERGDSSTGEGPCTFCGWDYDDCLPEGYLWY